MRSHARDDQSPGTSAGDDRPYQSAGNLTEERCTSPEGVRRILKISAPTPALGWRRADEISEGSRGSGTAAAFLQS